MKLFSFVIASALAVQTLAQNYQGQGNYKRALAKNPNHHAQNNQNGRSAANYNHRQGQRFGKKLARKVGKKQARRVGNKQFRRGGKKQGRRNPNQQPQKYTNFQSGRSGQGNGRGKRTKKPSRGRSANDYYYYYTYPDNQDQYYAQTTEANQYESNDGNSEDCVAMSEQFKFYLSKKQVAQRLGLSEEDARQLMKKGSQTAYHAKDKFLASDGTVIGFEAKSHSIIVEQICKASESQKLPKKIVEYQTYTYQQTTEANQYESNDGNSEDCVDLSEQFKFYLTKKQVAQRLGLSEEDARKLMNTGKQTAYHDKDKFLASDGTVIGFEAKRQSIIVQQICRASKSQKLPKKIVEYQTYTYQQTTEANQYETPEQATNSEDCVPMSEKVSFWAPAAQVANRLGISEETAKNLLKKGTQTMYRVKDKFLAADGTVISFEAKSHSIIVEQICRPAQKLPEIKKQGGSSEDCANMSDQYKYYLTNDQVAQRLGINKKDAKGLMNKGRQTAYHDKDKFLTSDGSVIMFESKKQSIIVLQVCHGGAPTQATYNSNSYNNNGGYYYA